MNVKITLTHTPTTIPSKMQDFRHHSTLYKNIIKAVTEKLCCFLSTSLPHVDQILRKHHIYASQKPNFHNAMHAQWTTIINPIKQKSVPFKTKMSKVYKWLTWSKHYSAFPKVLLFTIYTRGGERWSWRAGVPAEFSSSPNQTHLMQLIKVFRMQLG